jgi:hypothetical protein
VCPRLNFERKATRRRPLEEGAGGFIRECEGLLNGELLVGFTGNKGAVPEWAWISVLAHASTEYLVSCASSSRSAGRCVWERTVAYVATLILDHAASTGQPVETLQHEIILPLELGLRSRPIGPSTLVRVVRSTLGEEAQGREHKSTDTTKRRA